MAELVYHIVILVGVLGLLGNTYLNMLVIPTARRREPMREESDPPLVSVLVPARDEEGKIGRCVASLLAQDHPRVEVFVLDDGSTDETRSEALEAGLPESNLLSGVELPDGWAGKNWACHQLSKKATGDWLLFTDADTIHEPHSVTGALALAQEEGATLLSAWPLQRMGSWSERWIIPLIYLLAAGMLPHVGQWLARRVPLLVGLLPKSMVRTLGAANGQFMFFSRVGYDLVGGHASCPDHLVEDVALGKATMAALAEGGRLVNVDGQQLLTCRMYRDWDGVREGFAKNLRPVFEDSGLQFFLTGIYQICCQVLPFVFLFFAKGLVFWLVLAQVVGILLVRVILALRFGSPLRVILVHPLSILLACSIAMLSWWRARTGKIRWKGRGYSGL